MTLLICTARRDSCSPLLIRHLHLPPSCRMQMIPILHQHTQHPCLAKAVRRLQMQRPKIKSARDLMQTATVASTEMLEIDIGATRIVDSLAINPTLIIRLNPIRTSPFPLPLQVNFRLPMLLLQLLPTRFHHTSNRHQQVDTLAHKREQVERRSQTRLIPIRCKETHQ